MHFTYIKRVISIFIILILIISLIGCSSNNASNNTQAEVQTSGSKQESESKSEQESESDSNIVNNTYLTGLPIVKEPITLKVAVPKPSSAFQGPWDELDWIKQIQEVSGIKFEFYVWNSNEEKNLIFTSRDYPDIMFTGPSDTQILDAAAVGDIYPLNDLIEKYSPNWKKFFEENDYARKVVTMTDGNIWSLPIVRDEPSNGDLRDQWLINKKWLDELGLEVPTTTEEFYNVLKAFKENAGTGSIPENVIPYYIFGVINNIGGALDMISTFGIPVANERGLVTVDDNGKVEFNFANEAIKEPIQFLRKLYVEGLLPSECFTDDWDTYLTKTRSVPPMVGSFHSYQNPDASNTEIVAMAPLDPQNGKKPLIRRQSNHILRNCFTIFKNNKYPEASMRLADLIADEDWSIQAMYGMYGDTYLKKNDDGTIEMLPYEADAQGKTSAPMNRVPFLLTSEIFSRFTYAPGSAQRQRADAIENIYSKYTLGIENYYPNVMFTEEQTDRKAELQTDIIDYIASTMAKWIVEGGIEEEWDSYIENLISMGLQEYLQIMQEALDDFNSR